MNRRLRLGTMLLIPLALLTLAGKCPQKDPGFSAPSALRWVDLALVHGDPNGNVETLYVTGAGTRGYARLDSWTLDVATKLPLHLEQSEPFQGHDVKLHVLDPQSGLFVSGGLSRYRCGATSRSRA